jgi:hypothetical protein
MDYEQLQQEESLYPWINDADLMDAMSDIYEERLQAMRETDPEEWEGYDDQA